MKISFTDNQYVAAPELPRQQKMMDSQMGNKLGRKERGLTTQRKKLASLLKVLSFG